LVGCEMEFFISNIFNISPWWQASLISVAYRADKSWPSSLSSNWMFYISSMLSKSAETSPLQGHMGNVLSYHCI
jgi:hypothetical protein